LRAAYHAFHLLDVAVFELALHRMVDGVAVLMRSEQLNHDEYDPSRGRTAKTKAELLVDKTGGNAGVTGLLNAKGLRFTPIMIHGGERVHKERGT
jgi:hypothetical protein